jgi:hypothetical protein
MIVDYQQVSRCGVRVANGEAVMVEMHETRTSIGVGAAPFVATVARTRQ